MGMPFLMTVIWVLVIAALALASYFSLRGTQARHENPADQTVVDFDQLPSLCRLRPDGLYVLFTLRQSGNEHQERRAFETIDAAIAAGISTMKRSGIPYVRIRNNTAERFEFGRPFHDSRGRAEGKKVGWVEIVRVES